MQTISILVAEKQELQHQIHESRSSMTQEHNSRQKFQDQLQDAKLNIQKLEREIQSSNDSVASLKAVGGVCLYIFISDLDFVPRQHTALTRPNRSKQ